MGLGEETAAGSGEAAGAAVSAGTASLSSSTGGEGAGISPGSSIRKTEARIQASGCIPYQALQQNTRSSAAARNRLMGPSPVFVCRHYKGFFSKFQPLFRALFLEKQTGVKRDGRIRNERLRKNGSSCPRIENRRAPHPSSALRGTADGRGIPTRGENATIAALLSPCGEGAMKARSQKETAVSDAKNSPKRGSFFDRSIWIRGRWTCSPERSGPRTLRARPRWSRRSSPRIHGTGTGRSLRGSACR